MPPKPHIFINSPLQSTMADAGQVVEVASNISELLPNLSKYIHQFNDFLIANNISISFSANNDMTIFAPRDAHDKFNYFETKLKVIDRLILTYTNDVDSLVKKGLSLEGELRKTDPNYVSQILDKANEFKLLKAKYPGQLD